MQKPPFLKKGDTVGLLALAGRVESEQLIPAIELLENHWGLKVVLGDSINSHYHQFAGNDAIRQHDFQLMLDNSNIKAIFSARGGYGSSRILDAINFDKFRQAPKWIIGFSDITAVHCHIHTFGIESLHATMPKLFLDEGAAFSLNSLKQLLFNTEPLSYHIEGNPINRIGEATGQLIGGNLVMLTHIIGTQSDNNTAGKILFLEDVGEYLYNLDRMMIQLKRAHKLKDLSGLIVGHFSEMKDSDIPFGKTANEIIQEAVADYHFPVCYHFPTGHEEENWAMPCGRNVRLTVENARVLLQENSLYL